MVAFDVQLVVAFRLLSHVHRPAVEPVVFCVVEQNVFGLTAPEYWWHTLSQSSVACGYGGAGCVVDEASPSSWNAPVSWTAYVGADKMIVSSIAPTVTPDHLAAFPFLLEARPPSRVRGLKRRNSKVSSLRVFCRRARQDAGAKRRPALAGPPSSTSCPS